MNNLDHIKSFYPENYKLDLSETMKAALSKAPNATATAGVCGAVGAGGGGNSNVLIGASHADVLTQSNANVSGVGYVTEKLYMLLQLYLQNKGWNPSAELLQCFTDLKDNAMLPSAAYLQVVANRLTLDSQGRLILRENGKIVLPFEHFANAVMLKHMSGPHGLHLSVDATVRAVIESYTIGREQFGMEKEFIVEVVQSCPSPACRYYKNHMGISPLPFMDQQFPGVNSSDFLQHLPHLPPPTSHQVGSGGGGSSAVSNVSSSSSGSVPSSNGGGGVGVVGAGGSSAVTVNSNSTNAVSSSGGIDADLAKTVPQKVPSQLQHLTKQQQNNIQTQLSQISAAAAVAHHHQQQLQQHQQQQQAAAAKHQQQITAALLQQQNRVLAQQSIEKFSSLSAIEKQRLLNQLDLKHFDPMAVAAAAANLQIQGLMQSQAVSPAVNQPTPSTPSLANVVSSSTAATTPASVSALHAHHQLPAPSQSPHSSSSTSSHSSVDQIKIVEPIRSNTDSLESNKDLLALHNGAWGASQDSNRLCGINNTVDLIPIGQDKIVRVFAELMRNMSRMKTYIRPSMCKPYGKQSESLQKTLMDTIQIVQTLRNCLPAPHIPVTSWKSESEGGTLGLSGNGSLQIGPTGAVLGMQASRVDNMH